jgi:hypothetical protein
VYAIRDRAETSIAQVNTEENLRIFRLMKTSGQGGKMGKNKQKAPVERSSPGLRQPDLAQGSLGETQLRSEPEVAMGDK